MIQTSFSLKKIILSNTPLWSVILLFVTICAIFQYYLQHNHHSVFLYPLDDAYIHMSISKNLAEHGVWGVIQHAFTPASSSVLWTVLLSMCHVAFGSITYAPLLINIASCIAILIIVDAANREEKISVYLRSISLVALVVCASLVCGAAYAMEHTLHALLSLLLLITTMQTSKRKRTLHELITLCLLAACTVGVQYEGLILVFAICVLELFRKNWRDALAIGVSSWVIISIFGVVSYINGWGFFPSSVAAKSQVFLGSVSTTHAWYENAVFAKIYSIMLHAKQFGFLWSLVLLQIPLQFIAPHSQRVRIEYLIVLLTTLIHATIAKDQHWDRYLLYLWVLNIYTCVRLYSSFQQNSSRLVLRYGIRFSMVIVIACSVSRTSQHLPDMVKCSNNLFDVDYRVGLFLKEYASTESVGLHDIGIACYLSDIRLTDFAGLASKSSRWFQSGLSVNARSANTWLVQKDTTQYAFFFSYWVQDGVPDSWMQCAQYEIRNGGTGFSGADELCLYARDKVIATKCIEDLKQFHSMHPEFKNGFVYNSQGSFP